MAFTDEDLKRMKENADGRPHFISTEMIIAVFARLEASEALIADFYEAVADMRIPEKAFKRIHAYIKKSSEKWLKAAGK